MVVKVGVQVQNHGALSSTIFNVCADHLNLMCSGCDRTLYWSVHYTWQGALIDVDERLDVADNSIQLIQNQQAYNVRHLPSLTTSNQTR